MTRRTHNSSPVHSCVSWVRAALLSNTEFCCSFCPDMTVPPHEPSLSEARSYLRTILLTRLWQFSFFIHILVGILMFTTCWLFDDNVFLIRSILCRLCMFRSANITWTTEAVWNVKIPVRVCCAGLCLFLKNQFSIHGVTSDNDVIQ